MAKFSITKDFERESTDIGKTGRVLEILRIDDDEYAIIVRNRNGILNDCGSYSLEELHAIHKIISE